MYTVWIGLVSKRFGPEELYLPCILCRIVCFLGLGQLFCHCFSWEHCWLHCRVTSIRLCVVITRERKRWIKKWDVEKSAYLWRVSVKDFKVWQKPYSLTLIAEGHLQCTYTQRRLLGSHCWERNVTLYSRLQTKVLLYACGCMHFSSLLKRWLSKLQ